MSRYIDAEKAKKAVYWDAKAIESIDQVPTADIRENVHGKWVKNEDRGGWHCSCCKVDDLFAYISGEGDDEYELLDKFCPNCGADMRERRDDVHNQE